MKLKKFLKPFTEHTSVVINEDNNEVFKELYTGEIFNVPKKLLNYKIDVNRNAFINTLYFTTRTYTKLIIYVKEPGKEVINNETKKSS